MITREQLVEFLDNATVDDLDFAQTQLDLTHWRRKKGLRAPGKGKGEKTPYRALQEFPQADVELLYDCLLTEIEERTGENYKIPLSVLREREENIYKKYMKRSQSVLAFINSALGKISDTEKYYVYPLLIRALIGRLEAGKVSISLNSVVGNMDKIPDAINRAFPGYAKAGILRLVLSRNRPNTLDNRGRRGKNRAGS